MKLENLKVGMYFKFMYHCCLDMVLCHNDCLIYKITESHVLFYSRRLTNLQSVHRTMWHSYTMPPDVPHEIRIEDLERKWIFSDTKDLYISDYNNPRFDLNNVNTELVTKVNRNIHRYLISSIIEYKGIKYITYAFKIVHTPYGIFFQDNFFNSKEDNRALYREEYLMEYYEPVKVDDGVELIDRNANPSHPWILEIERDLAEYTHLSVHTEHSEFFREGDYYGVIFNVYPDLFTNHHNIQKEYRGCKIEKIDNSGVTISCEYMVGYPKDGKDTYVYSPHLCKNETTEFRIDFNDKKRYQFQDYKGRDIY